MSSLKKPLTADEDLFRGLKVSMGLHAAILIAFTVKTVLFADPEPIDYSAAIRVDMVALPEKMSEAQQLPPKQEEAKPEVKPEPPAHKPVVKEVVEKPVKAPKKDLEAVNLTKEKNKQKEALEKTQKL